jgi:methyl-accepting chemotaxis protein
MKLKNYLLGGYMVLIALFAVAALFVSSNLGIIAEQGESLGNEIHEVENLIASVLDFNVENFHTQLEVWEYAYDPTPKRFAAYEEHNEALTKKLDALVQMVESESEQHTAGKSRYYGSTSDAEERIQEIASDLEMVRADWNNIFGSIEKYESARDAGASVGELKTLSDAVYAAVVYNEDLFDELEFNEEVDNFVQAQQAHKDALRAEQRDLITRFHGILVMVFGLLVVVAIVLSFAVNRIISKPLSELALAVDEISKGSFSVDTNVRSRVYEINVLAESLNRILTTMKRVVRRVGLNGKKEPPQDEQ